MIKSRVELDMSPADGLRAGGLRLATRIGMNRAASPVKASVVSHAEAVKRYGYTAKAVRIRVKEYPADRFVTVVGPSMNFVRTKGKYKRGPKKGQPRRHRPAFYAHLSNSGTKRSRALHWLDKAHAESAPGFLARVGPAVGAEIEKRLTRPGGR